MESNLSPNLIKQDFKRSLVYQCLLKIAHRQFVMILRLKDLNPCEQAEIRLALATEAVRGYQYHITEAAQRTAKEPVSIDVFETSIITSTKTYLVKLGKENKQGCHEMVDAINRMVIDFNNLTKTLSDTWVCQPCFMKKRRD